MMKRFTVELDKEGELIEIHLNKIGAEYLRDLLNQLIDSNTNDHVHLMTDDWGGSELSLEKVNQSSKVDLLHHLKVMYWK